MPIKTTNLNRPMGAAALRNVERQRQMAAALQGQAMQPLRGQMAGRVYVAPSPMQGVAKLGQMLAGTYAQNKTDEREAQIQADQRQAFATDMQAYQDAIKGTPMVPGRPEVHATPPSGDPFSPDANPYQLATEYQPAIEEQAAIPGMDRGQAAMQHLINSQNPMAQKMGMSIYEKSLEEPTPLSRLGKLHYDSKNLVPGTPEHTSYINQIKANAYINPPSDTNVNVSVGGNQADKDYASQFVDWTTGSFADTMKGLDQLKLASKELGEDATLTGAGKGLIPDHIRAFTNPKALSNKNKVEEVVQRNLRVILGAQFTEKEGVRLIERAYNPDLPVKENKRRVDALIKQIETAAKAKNEAAKYFRIHRTLDGFEGMLPTKEDFNPDVVYQAAPQSERSPETQAIMDIYK